MKEKEYLPCPVCDTDIQLTTEGYYTCPKCGIKLVYAADEDGGGNYYAWLERRDAE